MSETADKLISKLEKVGKVFQGKKLSSWNDLGQLLSEIVPELEGLKNSAGEILSGNQKKEIAIEVVLAFVKIPYVPKFMLRLIVSKAIDALIGFLNRKFGDKWTEALKKISQ